MLNDWLPDSLCDVVYSYFCHCEVVYFKHKDQKDYCHLSHDQLKTCDILPCDLFLHCCEKDDVEIVPHLHDADFVACVEKGIRIALQSPCKLKMMDWIMNRVAQMDITYLTERFLSKLFCCHNINDEAGYNWFMKHNLGSTMPAHVFAIREDDVVWLSKLTFDKREAIQYAVDHSAVQSLLYLCDNQVTAHLFEQIFDCLCTQDANLLYKHVTDRANIHFQNLLDECRCADTLEWIVAQIPNFDMRDYIAGLKPSLYALECMEKFQMEVNTMTWQISSCYIESMAKVNPNYFKRDVETYWNKSVTVLREGLELGGFLTRPLPEIDPGMYDMKEINESSLGDDVIRDYIDKYATDSCYFHWIEKHIARVYPEPNTIYNMLIDKVPQGSLFELCCSKLDWTTLNIRGLLTRLNANLLYHVKDHLQPLFTCALEKHTKVVEILHFAQTNGIVLKAANLELKRSFPHLDEQSRLKLLQAFPEQCAGLVNNHVLKLLLRKRKRV